jgi:hypothetical protein
MASRRDFYYRQLVTEAELDASNDDLEAADRSLMVDMGVFGALDGLEVAEAPSPNLTVNVAGPGAGYDQLGQRIAITATQNKDVSVDYLGAATSVASPGNEKWVSLFIQFARTLSDARIDGNSNTVYFVRSEAFTLKVVQGAEALIGAAAKPSLLTDGILLADINRTNGQTQILNADINTERRQDYLRIAGIPNALARGQVKDAISDLLALINTVSTTVPSTAGGINYAGGGAWADGTANPAQTVEAWIDGAISGFAATTGSSGADKIGVESVTGVAGSVLGASTLHTRLVSLQDATNLDVPARSAWRGGRTNPATTVLLAMSKVIDDLGLQTVGDDGAERIGAQASGNLAAGSVRSQLDELDTEKGGLASANSWAGLQTFSALARAGGGAGTGYAIAQSTWADADATVTPSGFHLYYQNAVLSAGRNLALSTAGAENGTVCFVTKNLSAANTLSVRNNTTGGTILASLTSLGDWCAFVFRGGAWVKLFGNV